jgi:hypothetical protein
MPAQQAIYKFIQFSNEMILVDLPVCIDLSLLSDLPGFSGFHVFVGLGAVR